MLHARKVVLTNNAMKYSMPIDQVLKCNSSTERCEGEGAGVTAVDYAPPRCSFLSAGLCKVLYP